MPTTVAPPPKVPFMDISTPKGGKDFVALPASISILKTVARMKVTAARATATR